MTSITIFIRRVSLTLAMVMLLFVIAPPAMAQTWTGASSGAWLTAGNWSGGIPGSTGSTTNTNIALFAVTTQPTTGINMNTAGGNYSLGAIDYSSTGRNIGNSSTTVAGTLRLNGATVNSVANVIVRNSGTGTLTIQANQTAAAMALLLGNASNNNIVNVDAAGIVAISSSISGSGQKLTVNTATTGQVQLSGTNTWTGGTDITGGTSGGNLRIGAVASLPTTGTVAVSTGGRLTLNVSGTYGGASQALTFNPNQTTNSAFDNTASTAAIWQGTVAINADTRMDAGTTGTLTLSGNVSGSGALIKGGTGNLVFSGTGNTQTSATQILAGTITVNSGSLLGTGDLTLAQTSTNTTTLTLNNSSQSVGSLSSTWTATSGTIDQRINLNGGSGTTLTINQTTNGTFGTGLSGVTPVPTLTSTIAGTGSIIKNGSATLTLTSANGYDGTTTINNGFIAVDDENRLGAAPGSFTANRIILNGGGLKATGTTVTFATGGPGTGNRGITLGASGGTFDTNGQGIAVETPIAGTSGGSLTKIGASSALTLNAANTYDGATNIQDGTLALYAKSGDSTNRLPATTVLTLGNTGTSGNVVLGSNGVNIANPAHQTVAGLATNVTTSTNTITSDTTTNAILTINNPVNYTFAGTIGTSSPVSGRENNIDLVKLGNGVQVLSGNNSYTGTTKVNAGTLLVNGTHSGGNTYTVDTGGTLGGNGTINSPVNVVTGTIAPGTSPGRLTVNGGVAFTNAASSVFSVEINGGTTAGTDYDQLRVGSTGSLTLNGATLTASLGFSPLGTEKIFLTDNLFASPITGQFDNLPEGSAITIGDYTGIISYLGDFATLNTFGGNDVVIYNLTAAIPEPGTIALLGLTGFFGVQWYLRRNPAVAKKEGEKAEGEAAAEPAPVEATV